MYIYAGYYTHRHYTDNRYSHDPECSRNRAPAAQILTKNRKQSQSSHHPPPNAHMSLSNKLSITDLGSLEGKRVLIRVDFNVPIQDSKITNPAVRRPKHMRQNQVLIMVL